MPYRIILIGLGAGFISAVVFASATTGPLVMRLILFLLTPLALFLAGLGLGTTSAAIAGITGIILILLTGNGAATLVFATSQAIPVLILVYLASLNRQSGSTTEWYPVGRLVVAAALIAGISSTLTLYLLGGDLDTMRAMLRQQLELLVTNELPKIPDAPSLTPQDIDEATEFVLNALPYASSISSMASLLFNMWLAGRITLASGRLQRPWPDIPAMSYPPGSPLLLAVAIGASFLSGLIGRLASTFAGSMYLAYVLLGLAVVHFITRGRSWRPFALWGLYAAMFLINTIASPAVALLGLIESIWPMRRQQAPPNPPPQSE